MHKKLLALIACAAFSANASAAYVRYDFSGPISGYIVQHDDDQSIAHYRFDVPLSGLPWPSTFSVYPVFGEGADVITAESTYFRKNGPTNFQIYDDFGGDRTLGLTIDFSRATAGGFAYTATFTGSLYMATPERTGFFPFAGTLNGLVSKSSVDPALAQGLDDFGGYYEGVPKIIPEYIGPRNVPEPGTLALLALGAAGAAGAARRRRTTY